MAIFTLVFEGLICHVGPSATQKTRSVLVWSPSDDPKHDHVPKIVSDGVETFLLQHDTITFRNLPTGGANTDPEFRLRVPTLERLLNPPGGTIKNTVINGDPDPDVAATVELPFGNLGAPKRHGKRIKFKFINGDTELRCVPQYVLFTTVTSSSTVEIIITHRLPSGEPTGPPRVLVVSSNSTVEILNLPQEAGGNHFGHFVHLTTSYGMALVNNDGSDCLEGERGSASDDHNLNESMSAYAKLVEAIPSTKEKIARETAARRGEELTIATSNPECTNSGWP